MLLNKEAKRKYTEKKPLRLKPLTAELKIRSVSPALPERSKRPQKKGPEYKAKLHLIMRPEFSWSGNVVYTHDLRNSMNERTHFFIKICISHTLFSKGLMFLWCVRDGWRHIYSERGLLPIFSARSQGVSTLAHPCKLVRDASGQLRVPRSTAILCTLSKSHSAVLITWSPSGSTPVRPECPDRSVLFTNQNVTACQSTWGH